MRHLENPTRAVMPEAQPSDDQPSSDVTGRPALTGRMTRSLVRVNRSANVDAGLGQGMEMALTLCVFLGLGWLVDRAAGTSPLFMVILVVFAMIGQSARMWFTYDARMKMLEAERRQRAAGSVDDAATGPGN
ncbi:MAG: AtpZ/AtpI family protein [Actinomycetota bacterium]